MIAVLPMYLIFSNAPYAVRTPVSGYASTRGPEVEVSGPYTSIVSATTEAQELCERIYAEVWPHRVKAIDPDRQSRDVAYPDGSS
jgi:hypothetical protein